MPVKTSPFLTALRAMKALLPTERENVNAVLAELRAPSQQATAVAPKAPAVAAKTPSRACTVCGKAGHDRRICPKAKAQAGAAKARAAKAAKKAQASTDAEIADPRYDTEEEVA